jgi:hypothetical protein
MSTQPPSPLAGDSEPILRSAMVRCLGAIAGSRRCNVAQPAWTSVEKRSRMNECDLSEATQTLVRRGLARRPVP